MAGKNEWHSLFFGCGFWVVWVEWSDGMREYSSTWRNGVGWCVCLSGHWDLVRFWFIPVGLFFQHTDGFCACSDTIYWLWCAGPLFYALLGYWMAHFFGDTNPFLMVSATGLYYLAELMEEYEKTTKKIMRYAIAVRVKQSQRSKMMWAISCRLIPLFVVPWSVPFSCW